MSKLEDEDWFVCCSDEEKYTSTGCKKGKLEWTPEPDIMIQLFEQIDKGKTEGNCLYLTESSLNLEWKCPGRRPPTPSDDSEMDDDYDGKLKFPFFIALSKIHNLLNASMCLSIN